MSAYQLTPREREALELLASGMTPKKIAEEMNISIHTYKDTIDRARMRLNAWTTAQAVYIACKRGIL